MSTSTREFLLLLGEGLEENKSLAFRARTKEGTFSQVYIAPEKHTQRTHNSF